MPGIASSAAAGTPKVLTFVIGVGTSLTNLNAIAAAGGTTKAYLVSAGANVTQQFIQALNDIRKKTLGCEYQMPKTDAGIIDPSKVELEWTPTSATCTIRRDGATIREEARIFIDIIERHYGQRPMIYTTVDFFQDTELWRLKGVEFWLRSVADHPHGAYDGSDWSFWQYTSTGLVPGVSGPVDVNVFAGSSRAWSGWLDARAQ